MGKLGEDAGTGLASPECAGRGCTAYATAAPPASPSRPHSSATTSPRTPTRHTVSTARSPSRKEVVVTLASRVCVALSHAASWRGDHALLRQAPRAPRRGGGCLRLPGVLLGLRRVALTAGVRRVRGRRGQGGIRVLAGHDLPGRDPG